MKYFNIIFDKGMGFVFVYLIAGIIALVFAIISKKDRLYKFFSVLFTLALLYGVVLLITPLSCKGQGNPACGWGEGLALIFIVAPLLIISSLYLVIAYFVKKRRGQELRWYNHLFIALGFLSLVVIIGFWYIETHLSPFRNQSPNVIQERN